jgi:hypothetical protein
MLDTNNDEEFAKELNEFYARFDSRDESNELEALKKSLHEALDSHLCPSISVKDVSACLKRQKVRKAPGPDMIGGKVLNSCSEQLAGIFTLIFNRSLRLATVPSCWKLSTLVPLPKLQLPAVKNDLRLVALTDLIMKNFERLFSKILSPEVVDYRDPLQFAYNDSVGVEDAVITMLHHTYSHLDTANSAV